MAKGSEDKDAAAVDTGQAAAAPMVAMSQEQFASLIAALSARPDKSPELQLAIDGLRHSAETNARLSAEVARTVRRSNADHSHQSAFTFDPRCNVCLSGQVHEETGNLGHPKPKLSKRTYFCYGLIREEQVTPVEIELFNAFTESKEARDGVWTATIEKVGRQATTLHVLVPCLSLDDMVSLPPLTEILAELLYGRTVVDPVMSLDYIKALEARVKELERGVAPAPALAGVPAPAGLAPARK